MMNRQAIERKAGELLKRLRKGTPPIDVERIAQSLGARVLEYPEWDDDLSAVLAWMHNDQPVIIVNADHHEHRQRFSIAHEIGHLVLHAGKAACHDSFVNERPGFRRGPEASTGESDIEVEANQFAAVLLMPRQRLIKDYIETPEPSELADKYKVSEAAMGWRLINLRLA